MGDGGEDCHCGKGEDCDCRGGIVDAPPFKLEP